MHAAVRRAEEEAMFMSNLDSGEESEVQHLNDMIARLEGRDFGQQQKQKRNYNLDHLARMNFRRSMRAGFNSRHILGGLRKRAWEEEEDEDEGMHRVEGRALNSRHILGGLKRALNSRHILGGLKRAFNNRHILGGL